MATVDENEVKTVFTATTDQFVSHVAQIREILQGFASPLRALRTNLGEVAEAFVAAFAVEKIEQFIDKISEMGAEVEHATHELGMSADEVTTITTAFTLMGLSTERGIFSLERLERSMTTARNSAGPAAEAFTALGIPLDQLKTMNPTQVLEKMADVFSTTRDGANKTAIAMALFGRAGAQMIPWLDRGREGLEEFRQVAEETGVNMSGPMVRGMEETKIAMSTLDLAFKGLEITVYEAFKPQFDTVIRLLIEFVEWVNNGIKGTGTLNTIMAALAEMSGIFIAGLVGVVDALRAAVTGIAAFFDAIEAIWPVISRMSDEATTLIVHRLAGLWEAMFILVVQGWDWLSETASTILAAFVTYVEQQVNGIVAVFKGAFEEISAGWRMLANAGSAAIHGDIDGVKKAISDGLSDMADIYHRRSEEMVESTKAFSNFKINMNEAIASSAEGLDKINQNFKDALKGTQNSGLTFTEEMQKVVETNSAALEEAVKKAKEALAKGDEDADEIGKHFIETAKEILANIRNLSSGTVGIDVTGDSLLDRARQRKPPQKDAPAMEKIKPNDEKMAELEAELHREEQGWQIHWDQLKEFEAAFWQGILERTDKNAKDYNAIVNKAYSSQEALAHERVAKEGALEKEETANLKSELNERDQQEKAAADFNVQHGLMKVSAQIAAERKLTEDTFNQIRARLEYEKNTVGQMPEFYRKVNEEIVQLEQKHNGDLAALNRDSVADFIKPWEDATAAINSSMDTMLNGILMGTQSFSDAMKNLWNNLVLTLIEYELKLLIVKVSNTAKEAVLNNGMIMSWFGMETAKSTISEGAAAQRAAVDTTAQTGFFGHIGGWLGQWFGFEEAKTTTTEAAAAQRATVTSAATIAGNVALVAAAFGQIQVEAALAAAATFAAISAIPIIGPEIAPAAAAEAYVTTMGFASGLGGGLAFEQGGLIPRGVNPIAQLHQNEMILPAKLSQGMQGLIASGGVGAGGGDTTINVHVAGSNASPDSIARAVSQAMRDFHPAFRRR